MAISRGAATATCAGASTKPRRCCWCVTDPSATCASGDCNSASGSASSEPRSRLRASWPSSCIPCWSPANRSSRYAPQPDIRTRPRRKGLRDVPGRRPIRSAPFVASAASMATECVLNLGGVAPRSPIMRRHMPPAKTTMLPATASHKPLAPDAIRRRTSAMAPQLPKADGPLPPSSELESQRSDDRRQTVRGLLR